MGVLKSVFFFYRKLLSRPFAFQCTDKSKAQRCNQRHQVQSSDQSGENLWRRWDKRRQRTGTSNGDIRRCFTSVFSLIEEGGVHSTEREKERQRGGWKSKERVWEQKRKREIHEEKKRRERDRLEFVFHVSTDTFHRLFHLSCTSKGTRGGPALFLARVSADSIKTPRCLAWPCSLCYSLMDFTPPLLISASDVCASHWQLRV